MSNVEFLIPISTAFERLATTASASDSDELRDAAEFWAFVRRLPNRQRDAVTLYYLEDRTIADIATELGCSKNTAKAHLFKGRRRLAGWLDGHGSSTRSSTRSSTHEARRHRTTCRLRART